MCASNEPSQALQNAQKELERRRQLSGITYRPPASSLTAPEQSAWISLLEAPKSSRRTSDRPPGDPAKLTVRVAPTLAAWCLNKDHRYGDYLLDSPYRLYKILQALDHQGRGWLANSSITAALADKLSPTYIYGRRQLKNILRRGEGLFWNRVKSHGEVRIRLVARTKVAALLGCGRLLGKEITFPLACLLGHGRGRQADVNAALYTAVHAGQLPAKGPRPISRERLIQVSGCSTFRQRSYEKRAGIEVTPNIHIVGAYSAYRLARHRLHHQLPAYKHVDYLGLVNRHQRGAAYVAVRLPNSYTIPETFKVIRSRRQQTTNRLLDGLCHMGSGGSAREEFVRLFHQDAAAAVHANQQKTPAAAYWPVTQRKGVCLWRALDDLD